MCVTQLGIGRGDAGSCRHTTGFCTGTSYDKGQVCVIMKPGWVNDLIGGLHEPIMTVSARKSRGWRMSRARVKADHDYIPDLEGGAYMLVSTTPNIEGNKIVRYLGLVSGEAILGANIFKDFFAGIRDIVGGRSAAYEAELRKAKGIAVQEMIEEATALGANAVVAVDLDYETIAIERGGNMLMVSASGTAVVYEGQQIDR